MIGYARALRRATASDSDWNAAERISKATITWVDNELEYETEVENEGMTDSEFRAWVEEQAEALAREAATEFLTSLKPSTMTPLSRPATKPTLSSSGNAAPVGKPAPAESQAPEGACSRTTSWQAGRTREPWPRL